MDLQKLERRVFLSGLNARITEKNITLKELGKYLGIRPSQLSLWLSGNAKMSVDNLIKITNAVDFWEKRDAPQLHDSGVESKEPEPTLTFLLKKHIRQQGMAQKTLAAIVGTSQSRISEYVRGAVVPSLGVAARICKALKIDAKSFIEACSRL